MLTATLAATLSRTGSGMSLPDTENTPPHHRCHCFEITDLLLTSHKMVHFAPSSTPGQRALGATRMIPVHIKPEATRDLKSYGIKSPTHSPEYRGGEKPALSPSRAGREEGRTREPFRKPQGTPGRSVS